MSSVKHDVFWSPVHADKFVTLGTDLRLYKIHCNGSSKSGLIDISDTSKAQLVSVNSDNQFIKCVSLHPEAIKPEIEILLAVGLASGKIALTSFSQPISADKRSLIGREFSPKNGRQANCVSWNPFESSLLAGGWDKTRTDYAALVWDVNMMVEANHRDTYHHSTSVSSKSAIYEIGMGETVHSFQWISGQARTLVCGMNNKSLRLYDLRTSNKYKITVPSKAVYGLCMDPFNDFRMASYFENQIIVWDRRNFQKALVTIQEQKHLAKISWCKTRSHLLSTLVKESHIIRLHDIQQTSSSGNNYEEPSIIERNIYPPCDQSSISSFSWHPSHEFKMILVSQQGIFKEYTVTDRITLNWSPASEIIWTRGKKLLQTIDSRDELYKSIDDVSVKMRKRALEGYGFNSHYRPEEPKIANLVRWMSLVKSLDMTAKSFSVSKLIGVRQVLGISSPLAVEATLPSVCSKSTANYVPWMEAFDKSTNNPTALQIPFYKNEERTKAIKLCEWSEVDNVSGTMRLIDSLEAKGKFTRAAGVGVFSLRIRRAIQSLTKGSAAAADFGGDASLSSIAMALSGYSGEKNTLWKEMCSNLKTQLTDPYLHAIFTFLTVEGENYEEILLDKRLTLSDRVAFACTFLSDLKLIEYIDLMTRSLTEAGDLDGLLLTGVSNDGIDLLQHYVENTSDVQTVCLILLNSLPSPLHQESRVQVWFESYRNLLDCWRLWHQRAFFDMEWLRLSQQAAVNQLFVSCNFCGHSVSSYLKLLHVSNSHSQQQQQRLPPHQDHRHTQSLLQSQFSRVSVTAATHKTRIQSCPSCRKPLPRCALCLTQMGTHAGSSWNQNAVAPEQVLDIGSEMVGKKLSPFADWFSWCQSCRHGGHSTHLLDWFSDHTECPVTGCTCKCMALDAVQKMTNLKEEF